MKNGNMKMGTARGLAFWLFLGLAPISIAAQAFTGPVALRVDNLKSPLGIDDQAPSFSWQLQDPARGAKQSAYEVLVASREDLLRQGKADIWDSGRVASGESLNVHYKGPAIAASTRTFWRVKTWNAAGEPYTASEISWWETGLKTWHAQWIGFETAEEEAVRHAPAAWITSPDVKLPGQSSEQHIAYRQTVTLAKPVRHAALYATGQDTVSAWINGTQVLTADPLPPWKQMPWKKFVRADVSGPISSRVNTIAIETVHYGANPNGMAAADAAPMIATLVIEYADGTTAVYSSGTDWKSAIHAEQGWQQKGFDDSAWKTAIAFSSQSERGNQPPGHPWIPDSVKSLQHQFDVKSSVKSARLYSTALGAYEMFLNGKRVGDDVLAPGWTDYRQHVKYQTYDVTAQIASGNNVISALLAPGWYETPLEWFQQPNNYGDTPPALLADLRIEHTRRER